MEDVEVLPSWDTEETYRALDQWRREAGALMMAPFGPKLHALAMGLVAIESDSGLYYTQPKSYNHDYSLGAGEVFGYVVKWDDVPCYLRQGGGT